MQRIIVITLIALITGGSIAAAQLVDDIQQSSAELNIGGIGMARRPRPQEQADKLVRDLKAKMNVTNSCSRHSPTRRTRS